MTAGDRVEIQGITTKLFMMAKLVDQSGTKRRGVREW